MNRLILATVISALASTPALAAPTVYFNQVNSGTTSDPLAAISIVSKHSDNWHKWYVDPASGSASNTSTPAITLHAAATWIFDFTDLSHVTFTGQFYLPSYALQDNMQVKGTSSAYIDGRITFTGVNTYVTGIGTYDDATNTFSYSYLNPAVNGGGASTLHDDAPSSCVNGKTHILSKVCSIFSQSSRVWEGLTLSFVFTEDRSSFHGSMQAIDTSGTGLTATTTTLNWNVVETPIPPTAWLFGSALVGLATSRRQRSS